MITRTLLVAFGVAVLCVAPSVFAARQTTPNPAPPAKKTTSASAKKKAATRKRKAVVRTQLAPTPDRIKEIQSALAKEGAYSGEPTGKWDAATMDAMKKYQTDNGFEPTGKIDALSLNKLGLGAATAGKGAPVPTASTIPPAPAPDSKP
jgi:hypothetical protein